MDHVAGLVVVDSDLLIDFLRGRGEGVSVVRSLLPAGRLRFTAVTAFEVRVGADFLDRGADLLRLFRTRTLPLDLAAGVRAGEIHAGLRASGSAVGLADALQAGICIRFGLPLATRNRNHFERIPDLELVDLSAL